MADDPDRDDKQGVSRRTPNYTSDSESLAMCIRAQTLGDVACGKTSEVVQQPQPLALTIANALEDQSLGLANGMVGGKEVVPHLGRIDVRGEAARVPPYALLDSLVLPEILIATPLGRHTLAESPIEVARVQDMAGFVQTNADIDVENFLCRA